MNLNFEKYPDGLLPAIVQDAATRVVLMLGFMNREAFEKTKSENRVTFFSRSRQKLWTKGETSGNLLDVVEIRVDCDADTILIKATPRGPVCHTGTQTCFDELNESADFLFDLERVIKNRQANPDSGSYTSKLFGKGINKIAQKVGEEAVEVIIEAKDDDDELFKNESADLLYHLLVLLAAKNVALGDVLDTLKSRRKITLNSD